MPDDDRCVIHFMVPAEPGAPGSPSSLPKNSAALPPVLRQALAGTGQKWCFACTPKLKSSLRHHGTGEACLVNCQLCRKTQAWIDAPDEGAYPKDPDKPRSDELERFLAVQPVIFDTHTGTTTPVPVVPPLETKQPAFPETPPTA